MGIPLDQKNNFEMKFVWFVLVFFVLLLTKRIDKNANVYCDMISNVEIESWYRKKKKKMKRGCVENRFSNESKAQRQIFYIQIALIHTHTHAHTHTHNKTSTYFTQRQIRQRLSFFFLHAFFLFIVFVFFIYIRQRKKTTILYLVFFFKLIFFACWGSCCCGCDKMWNRDTIQKKTRNKSLLARSFVYSLARARAKQFVSYSLLSIDCICAGNIWCKQEEGYNSFALFVKFHAISFCSILYLYILYSYFFSMFRLKPPNGIKRVLFFVSISHTKYTIKWREKEKNVLNTLAFLIVVNIIRIDLAMHTLS